MKSIYLVMIATLTLITCKSVNDQEIDDFVFSLVDLDFENSNHSPWEGQYNPSNFSIGIENGNKFGIFKLNENGDYWTSPSTGLQTARSEIQLFNTCKINTEITYAFDVMIPNTYIESADWQIICQFHDQPDTSIGESWINYPTHSPPIAIKYRNGDLVISVYSWETDHVIDLVSVPIIKNQWNTIKLTIYWSVTNDGYLIAWLNDQIIQSQDETKIYYGRNCFNKASNYMKIGLYRSNDIMTTGEVYFDNLVSRFEE